MVNKDHFQHQNPSFRAIAVMMWLVIRSRYLSCFSRFSTEQSTADVFLFVKYSYILQGIKTGFSNLHIPVLKAF